MDGYRKVISFIAMSLDGYIAKTDGDISFLSIVDKEGEDYGYYDFIKTVDTVIIGRKTYDKVISMGFEYPEDHKDLYIITRTPKPDITTPNYYIGSPGRLVSELRSREGKNIFCDGGSEIINELLRENLIDEFYISVIPVILGDGIALFKNGRPEMNLKLISSAHYEKGLVQLHYARLD
jgi:dihydrofolate reductase